MEDKDWYNKVMLIIFCIILIVLGAGIYGCRVAACKEPKRIVLWEAPREGRQAHPTYR